MADVARSDFDPNSDAELERRIRIYALPAALVAAWLFVSTGFGRAFTRIVVGMWVHETGHAVAAWLCGYVAFPGPWFTPIAGARSTFFAVLISLSLIAATLQFWRRDKKVLAAAFAAILLLQLFCTLLLKPESAKQFFIFSGDGGCLVLGSILMATIYAREGSALHRGWLRWGFLAIGAGAFMDVFEQWWSARSDPDRIPFGMNEGQGLSDPSVLSDTYGWSANLLVHRYLVLGIACLLALALLYLIELRRGAQGDRHG